MSVLDKSLLDSKDPNDWNSVLYKSDNLIDKHNRTNVNKTVKITVTNIEDGWGIVRSYPIDDKFIYKVPLYICTIEGISNNIELIYSFKCIRFGVQYNPAIPIGPVVVGLKERQFYTLNWIPAQNLRGEYAWQIKSNWLIHRGSQNPQFGRPFGALGCIEIVGVNEWSKFNKTILELTGETYEKDVAKNKLATLFIEEVDKLPPLIKK